MDISGRNNENARSQDIRLQGRAQDLSLMVVVIWCLSMTFLVITLFSGLMVGQVFIGLAV